MAEIRASYKKIEINGRTFRIGKYNALTGAIILAKAMGIIAPLFKSLDLGKLKDTTEFDLSAIDLPGILSELTNLSEKDFMYVQERSLQVVNELLPGGYTQVLDKNGNFGVLGLDTDVATVLALTVHTVVFNVQGFFQGSPLASLLGGLSTTTQRD
jgi:hypothetical protein